MSRRTLMSYIKNNYATIQFRKYKADGSMKSFDDAFYAQFDGMYFNGLPVYYYLQKMNMGKCYDTSAILALAMGDGCQVCRGFLSYLPSEFGDKFHHGWVEKDGMVYDTTWQIIMPVSKYNKMYGVKGKVSIDRNKFFENNKKVSDWTIRTKQDYEQNFFPNANLLVFQVQKFQEMILEKPSSFSEKEITFAKKVLSDLPNVSLENFAEKCQAL